MIWVDASFAVEWLGGSKRAAEAGLKRARVSILPLQYAEVCVFFLRRHPDFRREALEALELVEADADQLFDAALLYVLARRQTSKASLADAVLAATVRSRGDELYTFDEDFRYLGMKRVGAGRWAVA